MSSIGTGYDLSVTTYSPDGRLYQVEYAYKAVELSGTCIGIQCKDGVVLGVENLIDNKMIEEGTNRRVYIIDKHAGMAVAGFKPDCRQIVNRGRSESKQYKNFFGAIIPGYMLCERISSYVHLYTIYWHLRPFGSQVLLATYDEEKGPCLYMIDPSGTSYGYTACCIGKGKQNGKTELDKLDFTNMTCKQAVNEIARMIYTIHDKRDKEFELELGWVCDESNKEFQKVPKNLKEEAIKYAKDSMKEKKNDDEEDLAD